MDERAQHHEAESPDEVTLVIPGRNCERFLRACLDAVVPMLDRDELRLREIIFVNDGSTDGTRAIAESYGDRVRIIHGGGNGAASARNLGWRAADTPLIWFIDSDCVAEPDALEKLLPFMTDPKVGGVSGSYGNMNPHSLVARLIHEEIIVRHARMGDRVDFLATFNVLYRRQALEEVGGFDERYRQAEDAELAFRVAHAGYELGFCFDSRVGHFHETHLLRHFRTQRQQGYWRAWLHLEHRGHAGGDSYSGKLDHGAPPLAMFILNAMLVTALSSVMGKALPILFFGSITALLMLILLMMQVPMAWRMMRHAKRPDMLAYIPFNAARAFWRGIGLTMGIIHMTLGRHPREQHGTTTEQREADA